MAKFSTRFDYFENAESFVYMVKHCINTIRDVSAHSSVNDRIYKEAKQVVAEAEKKFEEFSAMKFAEMSPQEKTMNVDKVRQELCRLERMIQRISWCQMGKRNILFRNLGRDLLNNTLDDPLLE